MIGPGKYDEACTKAREETGGGTVLIVLEGKQGEGFSAQLSLAQIVKMPQILRTITDQIEADFPGKAS